MEISFLQDKKIFILNTEKSSYQMQIDKSGFLLHSYYGAKISGTAEQAVITTLNNYCPKPSIELGDRSQNSLPLEYSVYGSGDYRTPCLKAVVADGARTLDLRYESHKIINGKPALKGLPATYFNNAKTLEITLKDTVYNIRVALSYTVAEGAEAIIRNARIINNEKFDLVIESALSCCLDFNNSDYDLIRFMGRAVKEREQVRTPLTQGTISAGSTQGLSSHSANPFAILCEHDTNEKQGECYGMSFVYSGNFTVSAFVDPTYRTRLTCGINPDCFQWTLAEGEEFQTPEVILTHSSNGFGELSRGLHKLYRNNLCRGEYKNKRRPIVVNSWEAVIFDFDSAKLVDMARSANKCGIEMLVLDDGWFGKRNWDDNSLGDWFANEEKLGGTLKQLVDAINNEGMKFGLWFEPEMISEDSDLYRAHPDWCLHCPGRTPAICRYQLVLDMSRSEVVDYLYDCISNILRTANVEYIKWDFNRPLTDVYSLSLPANRQGEVFHRYMLGVYSLLERLTTEFPNVLFEGCASGGGRFDAGMLYYYPQIWCSDNSDAADRLFIQYDTSFGYPLSSISAHVSPEESHQTDRLMPLKTRGVVAMTGAFGYELDVALLSDEEIEEIKAQVELYKQYGDLIVKADYYRLTSPYKSNVVAWEYVAEDKNTAIVGVVQRNAVANPYPVIIKLDGLEHNEKYNVSLDGEILLKEISGSSLMNAGLVINQFKADFNAYMYTITKI